MSSAASTFQELATLEAQAARAAQSGRDEEAARLWTRVVELDRRHVRAWTALGQLAYRRGDAQQARKGFQSAIDADGSHPQQWVNLALACRNLKDEPAEEAALKQALSLDPLDLLALILKADLLERQGKTHDAARAHGAVTRVAPPLDRLHPDLRAAVTRAMAFKEQYDRDQAAFLDRYLEPHYQSLQGEDLKGFRDSVDMLVGRKRRYDSQSLLYHYPYLPPIEFFERDQFPWLDPVEAATDDIRDEFLAVLASDEGFTPYITYPKDVPSNQFAELNNSPRWSAFHLYSMGRRMDENADRCPRTMAALAHAPMPDQPGRTPAAMYSLLKPRTRIPAHTGVTNVRLVTHLPLIIPENCRFRVGNDVREWVPGKAWVFDDTIEHEAWNDSDKLRVVMIFDIWHPHLTPAERSMVTALMSGINAYAGSSES
jgi:aspartyl/asparaginyl beta-hydroxylase (cupin superfamily)